MRIGTRAGDHADQRDQPGRPAERDQGGNRKRRDALHALVASRSGRSTADPPPASSFKQELARFQLPNVPAPIVQASRNIGTQIGRSWLVRLCEASRPESETSFTAIDRYAFAAQEVCSWSGCRDSPRT